MKAVLWLLACGVLGACLGFAYELYYPTKAPPVEVKQSEFDAWDLSIDVGANPPLRRFEDTVEVSFEACPAQFNFGVPKRHRMK